MTNKLSFMHKGCTGKVCSLDSSDILFHFLRSEPPYTASSSRSFPAPPIFEGKALGTKLNFFCRSFAKSSFILEKICNKKFSFLASECNCRLILGQIAQS